MKVAGDGSKWAKRHWKSGVGAKFSPLSVISVGVCRGA
jgi:hypothetical protein